jgi:hypothetical protein
MLQLVDHGWKTIGNNSSLPWLTRSNGPSQDLGRDKIFVACTERTMCLMTVLVESLPSAVHVKSHGTIGSLRCDKHSAIGCRITMNSRNLLRTTGGGHKKSLQKGKIWLEKSGFIA